MDASPRYLSANRYFATGAVRVQQETAAHRLLNAEGAYPGVQDWPQFVTTAAASVGQKVPVVLVCSPRRAGVPGAAGFIPIETGGPVVANCLVMCGDVGRVVESDGSRPVIGRPLYSASSPGEFVEIQLFFRAPT